MHVRPWHWSKEVTYILRCLSVLGDEGVAIGGVDARAGVTLASDFFPLVPGGCELAFSGCSSHLTAFRERWL